MPPLRAADLPSLHDLGTRRVPVPRVRQGRARGAHHTQDLVRHERDARSTQEEGGHYRSQFRFSPSAQWHHASDQRFFDLN